ncbi:mRNA 3'-end-processing protein rna14 [Coniosporium tulheliwenetii]|uniref:mRNA 3'-end-processing protein rna14 n=1 Tax=Coniosporium tulheliwenetii TaxID=3383036 RepID=A0ACC2ZI73_9PEZI|nr:mRNA 3'-end-processing protein rna14 [Cladosporium sp. JES 115]
MADNTDAEAAFLRSMQSGSTDTYSPYNPAQQPATGDEEDEEDYDPSSLLPESADDTVPTVQTTSTTPSDSQPASRPASTVQKQPRTVGGFVVDDDDDEEETPFMKPPMASSNGLLNVSRGSTHTPQRSLSQTPSNTLPSSDVPIHSAAQDQGLSGVVPNGSTVSAPNAAAVPTEVGVPAPNGAAAPPHETTTVTEKKPSSPPATKARLPQDKVGIFEDRIAEDPRGDVEAWLGLINEHRKRNKLDDARAAYERFFKVFPTAAEIWAEYAKMEADHEEKHRFEVILGKSLPTNPHVPLWSLYLDHIRRTQNLTQDTTGQARQILSETYNFVLEKIGIDKDAGPIWMDYIQFLRSAPGVPSGTGWQDGQKRDVLRAAYQRAICIPTSAVQTLWKEYDAFESGINKTTGRKFLQEKSPTYMTARQANIALQNITRDLKRTTIPRLPPAPGFEGDVEYLQQVDLWNRWIAWEKDDPLVLKEEDPAAYKARVLYVYRQALMALRYWPEMWYDAAEFCFQNGLETEGTEFLDQGIAANPESCLLAFKKADRIESTTTSEEGEESLKARGDAVREPYNVVLDALYDLITKVLKRQEQAVARIKEHFAQQEASTPQAGRGDDDDEDDQAEKAAANAREEQLKAQIDAIQAGHAVEMKMLSRTVTAAWIALMRAMRRVQGKGKPKAVIGGSRQIFADARARGRVTSELYIAAALLEHYCYKDPAATLIFEKGSKLFKNDEVFAMAHLKHLIALNDITNARATFETTVSRLTAKPEDIPKSKPLFAFFHEYESHYGELSQVAKLEKRMADLFPEDPSLKRFAHRFAAPDFDPTAIRPIISPLTQARPKALALPMPMPLPVPTIEQPAAAAQESPRPLPPAQMNFSPKRPFDDSDTESVQQPHALNERRLMQRERERERGGQGQMTSHQQQNLAAVQHPPPPPPLPMAVNFLLSVIPPASQYNATVFPPQKMVDLLRNIELRLLPHVVPQWQAMRGAQGEWGWGVSVSPMRLG